MTLRAMAINYLLEETNAKGISWQHAQEAKTKLNFTKYECKKVENK